VRRAGQELLELLAAATPVPLHVTGLGRFEVWQGRRLVPVKDLGRRRAGQLLRFLLLQHHHRAPRDVIIEALWRGQAEQASAQLHQASSSLRRALEPDLPDKFPSRYLRSSGEMIGLALPPGSSVDFERFEAMTRTALRDREPSITELSTALALYDGELFTEDRYADWAAPRRSALAEAAAAAGATLATARLAEGDARGALADAALAIERDPLREDAVLVAMRAALAMGDRIGAVRLYRRHERSLREELDVGPSGALQEFAATAGVGHSP
jgi:DNA-binding SARP family transcriptional activator